MSPSGSVASPPEQSTLRNRLLAALSDDDFARLRPCLEPIGLELRQVLARPDEPFEHAYFPETGLASIVGRIGEQRIEIGLFGSEGMSATPLLLGCDRSPYACFVQIAGDGWRIAAADLADALGRSPSLSAFLRRYVQASLVQVAETAAANGLLTIEQRLARWLLMCRLRTGSDELPLTHEFLSIMLGVQRPGVTLALQALEETALITTSRGRITVRDHRKLEDVAGMGYGASNSEYRRLVAPL